MSFFKQLPIYPSDSILGLQKSFLEDDRENKVNLIIGSYEDPKHPYGGLFCVQKAQGLLLNDEMNKRYLPIRGLSLFLEGMRKLIFENSSSEFVTDVQALGGTGALHLGAKVFSMAYPSSRIYIPEQTWGNHVRIFSQQGLEVLRYPYYNSASRNLVFEETLACLESSPQYSMVLLQCCCHNPTGKDFTEEMWRSLAELMQERKLVPFFDTAYLGFGKGVADDKRPIEMFLQRGIPVFVAACASKNFSLYGERVGYFAAYSECHEDLRRISSVLDEKIRGEYSSPPRHGASIVSKVLSDSLLKKEWLSELEKIRQDIQKIREKFVQTMRSHVGHSFDFILSQRGFFGYPGFSKEQVQFLRLEKGIYTTSGARFNLKGITEENMDYVALGFAEAYQI
ncbi:Aromatic-amino-acid aminotransferase [Chlamydia avium]|uniref:Aminotransferase class I and II family protein n=1 Tax=Chlamydia avium TaxID=1457141 RepID=A0ABN0MT51_9CHLA|nr:aromatic amino acid transaminase [Chlamydia avium]EPP36230.1 aminotransferase class I and II family protein [Chlamydia psittaci 10_743_SC13]EPP38684.1 aminotransferase class I and II family protein [Chlamydia avium]VVT43237.1 Aromatic-amino-acid aminotransferase [Chlamydia avium]